MAEQNKSNLWLIIGAIVVVLAVVYWYMSAGTAPDTTPPADTGAISTPAPDAPATDDGAVSVEPAAPATPDPAAPVTTDPATPAPGGTPAPASN